MSKRVERATARSRLDEHWPPAETWMGAADIKAPQSEVTRDALCLTELRRAQPTIDFGISGSIDFAGGVVLVHEIDVGVGAKRRRYPFEYGLRLIQTAGHD